MLLFWNALKEMTIHKFMILNLLKFIKFKCVFQWRYKRFPVYVSLAFVWIKQRFYFLLEILLLASFIVSTVPVIIRNCLCGEAVSITTNNELLPRLDCRFLYIKYSWRWHAIWNGRNMDKTGLANAYSFDRSGNKRRHVALNSSAW